MLKQQHPHLLSFLKKKSFQQYTRPTPRLLSIYTTSNIYVVWTIYCEEDNEEVGDNEEKEGVTVEDAGEFLHTGHVPFILSHSSIQSAWK